MSTNTFDAIVIGSGITGGWAAKELSEKGLKTLLLDRGSMVRHRLDYTTEGRASFGLPYRGQWPPDAEAESRFTHTSPVVGPTNYHFFNDDRVNPYINAAIANVYVGLLSCICRKINGFSTSSRSPI